MLEFDASEKNVPMEPNENAIAQEARRALQAVVSRGRRRLFFKRFVDGLAIETAAAVGMGSLIAIFTSLDFDVPGYAWGGVLLPFVVGAIEAASIYWRRSNIEIARQIDKANALGDRLSSSIDFLGQPQLNAWMEVQLQSTLRAIDGKNVQDALVAKTFEFTTPRHARACAVAAILTIVAVSIAEMAPLWQNDGDLASEENAKTEKTAPNLPPADKLLLQKQIEQIAQDVEQSSDKRFEKALRELESILDDDEAGKLSAEEYEKRLNALEKILEEQTNDVPSRDEQNALDASVRDAVKALTQMKEDPETREVAKALEENDYDKAADILRDLLKSADPKDRKKLEKLSRMFGDLAKNLDPTDPKLKEALKKNKNLIDDLKKTLGDKKLSAEDQKAFEEAAKKLRQAENEAQQRQDSARQDQNAENSENSAEQTAGKEQDPNDRGTSKASEAIDKLKNALEEQARQTGKNGADEQTGDERGNDGNTNDEGEYDEQRNAPNDANADGEGKNDEQRNAPNDDDSQNSGESPAENALRDLANQKKAQQQRTALQNLVNKAREDAENKGNDAPNRDADERERQKNVEDFLDRAKGQPPKRPPQDDDPNSGKTESQKEESNPQNAPDGSEQGQAERQDDQSGSEQGQAERQDDQSGSEQGQADQSGSEQGQAERQDNQSGSEQGQAERQDNQSGSEQGQADQSGSEQGQADQSGSEQGQADQSGSEQGQAERQDNQSGSEQGSQSGTAEVGTELESGNEPKQDRDPIDVQYRDEALKSQGGVADPGDMTTQQIIEHAGQKGFANQPYREVFQTYEKAAESVLDNETIPQGYRRYVEKYFDMIRPQ